jgi:hypothetical protein
MNNVAGEMSSAETGHPWRAESGLCNRQRVRERGNVSSLNSRRDSKCPESNRTGPQLWDIIRRDIPKMGADTSLAGAALAIALVALVTAFGQLLQQYFATADGYRRCQKSVMGGYARQTRLRWRWREFRFETLYTIPEIFLTGDAAPCRSGQILVTGSERSRESSLIPMGSVNMGDERVETLEYETKHGDNREVNGRRTLRIKVSKGARSSGEDHGEMVCWVPLLHWIHESTAAALKAHNVTEEGGEFAPPKVRIPAVVVRERSWDFQPPDVVRPLARTTLSDIAVIARRMGMKWKDFRPSDGILRAEGHSHTITSTVVRSLGIVLQYSYTGQGQRLKKAEQNLRRVVTGSLMSEQEEIYIPCAKADRLGCGVIRTESMLGLPDFSVSTQSEIVTALSYLDRSGESSAKLSTILKNNPEFRFRVADLVALTTPLARSRGSNLVQVPAPGDNLHGVAMSSIGRKAFRQCLEQYIFVTHLRVGAATQNALDICHDIGGRFAAWDHTDGYSRHDEAWVVTRDSRYLDAMQEYHYSLTIQLHDWEQEHPFRYHNLLRRHIKIAMFIEDGETSMLRNWGNDYKADVEGYFRVLPQIIEEMAKTGFVDRAAIVDAWVTMMLRAMLWGASHFFVPGERVPIQYFGSQLPVYIG